MDVMTIRDFEWGYFWGTFGSMSWCEFLMASVLALVSFRSYRRALVSIEGKSSILTFWVLVAAIMGCAYKALNNMDVATLPYAAFLATSFMDFRATLKRIRALNDAKPLSSRASAHASSSRGGKDSGGHSRSHSHGHSRRHGSHRSGDSSATQNKEPVYADPLAEDAASDAGAKNE